jgi:hypothetical protein
MPMIGPMRGEINMAPIITATLSVLRPSDATKIAKTRISSCDPLNDTPDLIEASVSACGSRSALTLKYDFSSVKYFENCSFDGI